MTIEGRNIKHPGLIRVYATPNISKITDEPLKLIGLDLETNHKTAELKLLGFWNGTRYTYYTNDFLDNLFMWVRAARNNDLAIAYWNRLDPFVLFKQFLQRLYSDMEREDALNRFGKISGEYDRQMSLWKVSPVIKVQMSDGYEFGISQAIRSSIQFYYNRPGEEPNKVWAYDIAQLYENGLENEATQRLPWYSKVDKSAHLVDWQRFETDKDYKENIVLKSNAFDARAVYELGYSIQTDFFNAFGHYPRTLISQGSLARAAIVANVSDWFSDIEEEKERKETISKEIAAIGLLNYHDQWAEQLGQDQFKDFYCLLTESYSGGYIEAIRYGYSPTAWYADIASAYPGVIQHLYDLRDAVITQGAGEPPHTPNSYVFIRGVVNIPAHINYHPITIKHPIFMETNIRAVGEYRASYTLDERDFLLSVGATFSDEVWYQVETKGELSPLAKVCVNFVELRKKFKKAKSSSQYMAKIAANSLYGILFEAVPTYQEVMTEKEIIVKGVNPYKEHLQPYLKRMDLSSIRSDMKYTYGKDLYTKVWNRWHKLGGITPDVVKDELEHRGVYLQATTSADIIVEIQNKYEQDLTERTTYEEPTISVDGYRAGEFWNPLYASIITARTRVLMSKAANAIERNGGKPIIMMTDSILWQGRFEDMPSELWREEKTLGFYEKPAQVTEVVALGSGRYGFTDEDGEKTAKRRGLNASEIHDPDGIDLTEFDWMNAIKIMEKTNSDKINITVRSLISPGVILGNHNYSWKDLGLVTEQHREVSAIVGRTKRFMEKDAVKNPGILANRLVDTKSIYIGEGTIYNSEGILDQSLPELRRLTMGMNLETKNERRKRKVNDNVGRYYQSNKDRFKTNYDKLRGMGYNSNEATKMCKWSDERLAEVVDRS